MQQTFCLEVEAAAAAAAAEHLIWMFCQTEMCLSATQRANRELSAFFLLLLFLGGVCLNLSEMITSVSEDF